eukprot:COSAG04_NODE_11511_length_705_cov_0.813531_3_plen_24_part_01
MPLDATCPKSRGIALESHVDLDDQ